MAEHSSFDLKDSSYKSRKFLLTILGLVLITGVSVLSLMSPLGSSVLPSFVGGILGVLGLYFTGNVVNKHVVGKNFSLLSDAPSPPVTKKTTKE